MAVARAELFRACPDMGTEGTDMAAATFCGHAERRRGEGGMNWRCRARILVVEWGG
jgi:hypothetical protein